MAREVAKIIREEDENGTIHISMQILNGTYHLKTFASQAEFLAQRNEWINDNLDAACSLALLCYLAVDPTGTQPELLTGVDFEVDPSALTIVRRVVPV